MKRMFFATFLVVCLMTVLFVPCVAVETALPDMTVEQQGGFDWLTDLWDTVMAHKSDILTVFILAVATLYEIGSSKIKNKVIPGVEKACKKAKEIAGVAGQITQDNKAQFKEMIEEMRGILAAGSEHENLLLAALEQSEATKEEYKRLFEAQLLNMQTLSSALMAQEQMAYETLMSAKLTDVRKEEIERQHLRLKAIFEAIGTAEEKRGEEDETMAS